MNDPIGSHNILFFQGKTFALQLEYLNDDQTPVNITGYTIRMQVRQSIDDPTVTAEFTTGNGKIVITDGPAGKFQIQMPATEAATIPIGYYVYDVELVNGAVVSPCLYGTFEVRGEVTR